MINKILILLTAAIMACPVLHARDFEYTFEGQTITYTVIDEEAATCMTKAYTNTDVIGWITGELVLPAKAWDGEKSYKLIRIGECSFRRRGVTKVSLPNTIEKIERRAFDRCEKLESIDLGNCVREMDGYVFNSCISLKELIMPNSVCFIDQCICKGCDVLTQVILSDSILQLPSNAFSYCPSLEQITIPQNVSFLGTGVFAECKSLKSIDFPDNIEIIQASTCFGCTSLESVKLPARLQHIYRAAFYGCSSLKSIKFPPTVASIGDIAFAFCSNLESVVFEAGNRMVEISQTAFVEIPVKELYFGRLISDDGGLFESGKKTAEKVVFENPVTGACDSIFKNWEKLESVKLSEGFMSVSSGMFYGCKSLKEITLPPGCYGIRSSAFENSGLTKISIGHNFNYIQDKAFNGCPLVTIQITKPQPPKLYDNPFDNYDAKVLVDDDGSGTVVDAYRNATGWGSFEISPMVSPTDMVSDGPDRIEGEPGAQIQLSAKLMPENVTIPDIHWSSSNIKIATVDHTGLVTFHGVPDENNPARIRPANAEELASCKITARSLYSNAPVLEFTAFGKSVVNKIVPDNSPGGEIDYSAPYEIYTLSGTRVRSDRQSLHPGLYIIRQGSNVAKTVIR